MGNVTTDHDGTAAVSFREELDENRHHSHRYHSPVTDRVWRASDE